MTSLLDSLLGQFDSGELLRQLPAMMRPAIDAWLREHHVVMCGELDAVTSSVTVQSCDPSVWRGSFLVTGTSPAVVVGTFVYQSGPIPSELESAVCFAKPLTGPADSLVARMKYEFELRLRHALVKELQG